MDNEDETLTAAELKTLFITHLPTLGTLLKVISKAAQKETSTEFEETPVKVISDEDFKSRLRLRQAKRQSSPAALIPV